MPDTRASGWPLETPDVDNPATFPEVVDRDVEHPTRVSVNPVATSPAPFVADLGDEGGDGEAGTPIDAALFAGVRAYVDAGDKAAREEAVSSASADATSKADAAKQAAIDDAAAKDAALKGELEDSIASGDASTLSQAAAKVQTAQATLEAMISELRDAKSNIKWVHCADETYDATTLKPKAESYPEPDPNALYLVPDPSAQEGNANVEWFWDSEQSDFERFGASVAAPAAISASAIQGLWERGESVTGTDVLNATGYQLTYEQIRTWVQSEAKIQVAKQLQGILPLANGGLGQNLDASNPSLATARQAAREAIGAASQDSVDSIRRAVPIKEIRHGRMTVRKANASQTQGDHGYDFTVSLSPAMPTGDVVALASVNVGSFAYNNVPKVQVSNASATGFYVRVSWGNETVGPATSITINWLAMAF